MKQSALVLAVNLWTALAAVSAEELSFNRDIRPILSDNCFACHGPDKNTRKAGRRLDTAEGAASNIDGFRAIVPGDVAASDAVTRITSTDRDEVMPPPKSDKKLTAEQIAKLKRWIAQGAKYEPHWAFIPPRRPPVPEVGEKAWVRNPIDAFIRVRLQQEGLQPSVEADRNTLLRRVSYDLTGLPPTPAEVAAFLADPSPDAYEKVVDRLLASPRYGERMTRDWLDLSRFADTHGYHLDAGREMWLWRDWVIGAFNRNMPFDRFTVEQIAGDLLPNATLEQKIATGFHRNAMINFEGGAIAEEYLTQYIKDRVATTSTVYLGLTLQCAECHDHKFDPVTQKEFYEMYAFFNAVPEKGIDGSKGNAEPLLHRPNAEQERKMADLEKARLAAEQQMSAELPRIDAEQRAWEEQTAQLPPVAWKTVEFVQGRGVNGTTFAALEDQSLRAEGANPASEVHELVLRSAQQQITAVQLESLPEAGKLGRAPNGNFVLNSFEVEVSPVGSPETREVVKFKRAVADYEQKGFEVAKALDADLKTGWAVDGNTRTAPTTAWFFAEKPFGFPGGTELRVRLRFEGGFSQHAIARARLSVASGGELFEQHLAVPTPIKTILALAPAQRDAKQSEMLRQHYRERVSRDWQKLHRQVADAKKASEDFLKTLPTVMVMGQMEKPRESFVQMRGVYNQPGEKVEPGVPASLPPLPDGAPRNRLGLAQWLVNPQHPLVARVTVNRFWQTVMGTGIVKTAQDFGSQAEWPSHPELLDWLATEFVTSGWDVKRLMRLIVTSSTYRQAARITPQLRERDPENRLYARGPRFRLGAEEIRDSALFVSGLLVEKTGGPSVRTYQPAGLWEELSSRTDSDNFSAQKFVQDHGENLYRRTMYTFWKRTSPPPSLTTFDAPDREKCTVSRERTNTPLQALVLMNDPTYVEAARKLAERMMQEGGAASAERIAFAFRLATARLPSESEAQALLRLFEKQRTRFTQQPEKAAALLAVGESPRAADLDPIELAAWTSVASTILNLDETVTKG